MPNFILGLSPSHHALQSKYSIAIYTLCSLSVIPNFHTYTPTSERQVSIVCKRTVFQMD